MKHEFLYSFLLVLVSCGESGSLPNTTTEFPPCREGESGFGCIEELAGTSTDPTTFVLPSNTDMMDSVSTDATSVVCACTVGAKPTWIVEEAVVFGGDGQVDSGRLVYYKAYRDLKSAQSELDESNEAAAATWNRNRSFRLLVAYEVAQ